MRMTFWRLVQKGTMVIVSKPITAGRMAWPPTMRAEASRH